MDIYLEVFKRIVNDDVQAYEMLFKEYYSFLCSFAYGHFKERHTAEEITEDFFADRQRAFTAADWPVAAYTTATLTMDELLAER